MMVCFLFSLKDAIEALDRPLTPSPEPIAEPVVMMSMTFFLISNLLETPVLEDGLSTIHRMFENMFFLSSSSFQD